MLKLNWKNTIIAGTLLTALCASAFAQEAQQPTIKQRVNAILNQDNSTCPPNGPLYDGGRRGQGQRNAEYFRHHHHGISAEEWAQKTPEEKRQLRQQWIKDWESKTPEEKEQLRQQWLKNSKQRTQEAMDKLSPEQKAQVEEFLKDDMENRRQMRERMQNMTPEQRDAIRANRAPAPYHAGYHHGYKHHKHRTDCWW